MQRIWKQWRHFIKQNVTIFGTRQLLTLTSRLYWTYPGNKLFENSICVLPEKSDYKSFFCKGICSDYILKYKNND